MERRDDMSQDAELEHFSRMFLKELGEDARAILSRISQPPVKMRNLAMIAKILSHCDAVHGFADLSLACLHGRSLLGGNFFTPDDVVTTAPRALRYTNQDLAHLLKTYPSTLVLRAAQQARLMVYPSEPQSSRPVEWCVAPHPAAGENSLPGRLLRLRRGID